MQGGRKVTRKVFLVLLALVLTLSVGLVACGGPGEEQEEEEEEEQHGEQEEEEEETYDLTIASTGGGSVDTPGEGTATYDEDTVVNLEATPDAYYRFVNWTGDVGTVADIDSATTTIVMNGDYSITANFEPRRVCIGFEDPPLGTEYHVGDTFTDLGAVIVVETFDWGGGIWCNGSCGYAKVSDSSSWCWPGGFGQHMVVNNVNLRIVDDGPWEGLSLLFGEYGGNLNIDINGYHREFDDFHDIDGDTIGGVDVSVVNGFGQDEGSLTLSGTINSFAIGGQELCIDDLCLTIPS